MENVKLKLRRGDITSIAKTYGCSPAWVSHCLHKKGNINPSERTVRDIAAALAAKREVEQQRKVTSILKQITANK